MATPILENQQITLYFGLNEGEQIDFEVAAAAAIQWVQSIRLAAQALDPYALVEIKLINAEAGSLRFNTIIDIADTVELKILEFKDSIRHPLLWGITLSIAAFLCTEALVPDLNIWGNENAPSELSSEDRDRIDSMLEIIGESEALHESNRKLFNTLQRDSSIRRIGITRPQEIEPFVSVPSEEFPARGGLWTPDTFVQQRRSQRVVDVVLETPDLSPQNRKWRFKDIQTDKSFLAKMQDAQILQQIRDGELPETLRQGIKMQLEISFLEEFTDGEWLSEPASIEVVKVTLQ